MGRKFDQAWNVTSIAYQSVIDGHPILVISPKECRKHSSNIGIRSSKRKIDEFNIGLDDTAFSALCRLFRKVTQNGILVIPDRLYYCNIVIFPIRDGQFNRD